MNQSDKILNLTEFLLYYDINVRMSHIAERIRHVTVQIRYMAERMSCITEIICHNVKKCKLQVSFAEYSLFYTALLQKRPNI